MSLKHTQFQDSPTMRSYIKVAREKGWIQEEPLKKEASAPDYQSTDNLMENIMKLCRGLRATGFDKYAEELESKFIQYKQAESAYDVSGETGEDLIDEAHPDGSHKLEGIDSDEAVIETIIDQRKKILDKIEKMPKGKLSTSAEVIDAVKMVFSQESSESQLEKNIDTHMKVAADTFNYVDGLIDREGELSYIGGILGLNPGTGMGKKIPYKIFAQLMKKDLATRPVTLSLIKTIENQLALLQEKIEPTFVGGGVATNIWPDVQRGFKKIKDHLQAAKPSVQKLLGISADKYLSDTTTESKGISPATLPATSQPAANSLMKQFNDNILILQSWKQIISHKLPTEMDADEKAISTDWVDKKIHQISTLRLGFGTLSQEDQTARAPIYSSQLKKATEQFPEFKAKWID